MRFQSTYLYKVRRSHWLSAYLHQSFNPRTYIRYDPLAGTGDGVGTGFNPRTYIRYDHEAKEFALHHLVFQSTYLYKVRPKVNNIDTDTALFQSTYLYKVRLSPLFHRKVDMQVSIHVPI